MKGSARVAAQDAADRFGQLADEARSIQSPDERAKALCELGYTAKRIGRDADASTLIAEGLKTAEKTAGRFFPLHPPAIGACEYWARLAGNEEPARNALGARVDALSWSDRSRLRP